MPVGIALANLAVLTVDQQLGMVVLSDTPALIDRLLLGVEQATRTAVAWPNGSPTVASRHNVYIFGISHLKTS